MTTDQLEEEIEQKQKEDEKFAELVEHVEDTYPEDEAEKIILGAYVKSFRPELGKAVSNAEKS